MDRIEVNAATKSPLPDNRLPSAEQYKRMQPAGVHLALDADVAARIGRVHAISGNRFADVANTEVRRLEGYYEALSTWLTAMQKSALLAQRLGISKEDYSGLAKAAKGVAPTLFAELEARAHEQGLSAADIEQAVSGVKPFNIVDVAKKRMLLMKGILLSTAVIMRDPFVAGTEKGSYGFGDGKKSQIFEGKAEIGGLRFSALASPRVHRDKANGKDGYVHRFCVMKSPKGDFDTHHPGFILDNRIVDNLERWHAATNETAAFEENPLFKHMSDILTRPVHDWIHGWLLYDVNAVSQAFREWGNDIFAGVDQLLSNKLLINYEIVCQTLHTSTWKMLMHSDPELKNEVYQSLDTYLQLAEQFGTWLTDNGANAAEAREQVDYLAYVALSNMVTVIDPEEPHMQDALNRYPKMRDQIMRILGEFAQVVHSGSVTVPSQKGQDGLESAESYATRYPIEQEAETVLAQDRLRRLGGSQADGVFRGVNIEHLREFEKLPAAIKRQVGGNVIELSVFGTLNRALETLAAELGEQSAKVVEEIIARIELDNLGRMFFRLHRGELDYSRMEPRVISKKVVLVAVPEGEEYELSMHASRGVGEAITKQNTRAAYGDLVAFNVQDETYADRILAAGNVGAGKYNVQAMIAKALQLSAERGLSDPGDVYPLRLERGVHLYGYNGPRYYENLASMRLIARASGPVVVHLHDNSDQKLVHGALAYIPPPKGETLNEDPNPDCHCIEEDRLKLTYGVPDLTEVRPFVLRENSGLTDNEHGLNAARTSAALHQLLTALHEINQRIDFGANKLADGLFGARSTQLIA